MKIKAILKRTGAIMATLAVFFANSGLASARIVFQDDSQHNIPSPGLVLDYDNTGGTEVSTSVQFGNHNTGTNGTLSWDITNDEFNFDNTVNITTGDLEIGGTGLSTTGGAALVGITDSGGYFTGTDVEAALQEAGAGITSAFQQDFEDIYSSDGDNTLTAGSGFTVNAIGNSLTLDADDFSLDSTTSSNITMNANSAGQATLSISALNSGAGNGLLDVNGDSIDIDSNTWDITSAGAASGFTTISASGNITTSGGDVIIGTTGLSDTTGPTTSGASLVGTFDEFGNSASANVQDVLDDLDAAITANASDITKVYDTLLFYPEYPDATYEADGTNGNGMLESLPVSGKHYYKWTTQQTSALNMMDIYVRYELPADLANLTSVSLEYVTGTTNSTDNNVDLTIFDASGTTCNSSTDNVSSGAGTPATTTINSFGTCSFAAGDEIGINVNVASKYSSGSEYAGAGFIDIEYTK